MTATRLRCAGTSPAPTRLEDLGELADREVSESEARAASADGSDGGWQTLKVEDPNDPKQGRERSLHLGRRSDDGPRLPGRSPKDKVESAATASFGRRHSWSPVKSKVTDPNDAEQEVSSEAFIWERRSHDRARISWQMTGSTTRVKRSAFPATATWLSARRGTPIPTMPTKSVKEAFIWEDGVDDRDSASCRDDTKHPSGKRSDRSCVL